MVEAAIIYHFIYIKKLFPKATNRYVGQPKTCKITLMHNGKEKMCKFFVVPNGSPAVLGMQDIDKLGLLSIKYSSKHRQVAEEDNKDNGKSPSQTEGGKCEQFKGEKQETETQSTQDTNNTNTMVTGNNSKELNTNTRDTDSIDFLSELLNNQSLISGTEIEGDVLTIDTQVDCDSINFISKSIMHQSIITIEEKGNNTATQNTKINNNENQSLILGIDTDVDMQPQTMQKKKRRQNKNKKIK